MLHGAATIFLGPLLLFQGRQVRRTIPILPEPPGPRAGSVGHGPELRLLVVGDSAAAGVGAASQAAGLAGQIVIGLATNFRITWGMIARSGATTAGTLRHLEQIAAVPFDLAVTSLGVNDITAGIPTPTWLHQQNQLVTLLRERFAVRHILLSSVPPMQHFPALPQPLRWYLGERAQSYNCALSTWAKTSDSCELVRLDYPPERGLIATDGMHPSERLYALWGATIAQRIETLAALPKAQPVRP